VSDLTLLHKAYKSVTKPTLPPGIPLRRLKVHPIAATRALGRIAHHSYPPRYAGRSMSAFASKTPMNLTRGLATEESPGRTGHWALPPQSVSCRQSPSGFSDASNVLRA